MKNSIMRKVKLISLCFVIIASTVTVAYGDETMVTEDFMPWDISVADNTGDKTEKRLQTFRNEVQGYSLSVPEDMKSNMDNSEVVAVLENDKTRLEIYRQSMKGIYPAGYINYSNSFIRDASHQVSFNDYIEVAGKKVHVLQFTREKLSRVEKDKNNYLYFDIVQGGYVYSLMIKSEEAISGYLDYIFMVESFETFTPTEKGSIKRTEAVPISERGWNKETENFYRKYFLEAEDLTWGIFEPQTALFMYYKLEDYEEYFNYKFPVILNYSEFSKEPHINLGQRLDMAWSYGKVLELTLQTTALPYGNMMYDILKGEYDVFLEDYAKTIAKFKHPVLFRLMNEMNGDWCVYSAFHTSKDTLIYQNVYRYIYEIFEKNGANENTIWVWNPNESSFPNFQWNHALMYYVGDEYVDLVGLTAYNTGTYYAGIGEEWKEFQELYDKLYEDYCRWFSQPFLITEFACASTGGDKAAWIKDMFRVIDKYEGIKMAIWWDGCDWDAEGNIARSYFINETEEIMKAFKQGLLGPWWKDTYA